jgi:hypothetical protein
MRTATHYWVTTALEDPTVGAAWRERHLEKYRWEVPASLAGVYRVVPHRVLAWMSDGSGLDGGVAFFSTPTEWRFGGDDDEVG